MYLPQFSPKCLKVEYTWPRKTDRHWGTPYCMTLCFEEWCWEQTPRDRFLQPQLRIVKYVLKYWAAGSSMTVIISESFVEATMLCKIVCKCVLLKWKLSSKLKDIKSYKKFVTQQWLAERQKVFVLRRGSLCYSFMVILHLRCACTGQTNYSLVKEPSVILSLRPSLPRAAERLENSLSRERWKGCSWSFSSSWMVAWTLPSKVRQMA